MPGVFSAASVVTTLVCFLFYTRGCGRNERPASPRPFFEGKEFRQASDTSCRENAEVCSALPASGERCLKIKSGNPLQLFLISQDDKTLSRSDVFTWEFSWKLKTRAGGVKLDYGIQNSSCFF